MERQSRLRCVELLLKLAHAPLPATEHLEDLEARRVRQGVKERHCTVLVG